MKVVVAGASGFVGRALVDSLRLEHDVIALSRVPTHLEPASGGLRAVEWRQCDLFSLLETEQGIQGAEAGIYLVHSIRPSTQLTQGTFEDFDLIKADNFIRAAEKFGFQQIVYLGGILPSSSTGAFKKAAFSRHLRSRQEVEEVFSNRRVPVTILRAAMILGAQGSSFQVMLRLVRRLPLMICPAWTRTKSQPIALSDVVACFLHVLGSPLHYGKTYDIAGPDLLTYLQMMKRLAERLKLHRKFVDFPVVTPRLSTLWVTLITQAPRELIQPLVNSLRCQMTAHPEQQLKIPDHHFLNFDEALDEALADEIPHSRPRAFKKSAMAPREVRSVQRLTLPAGWHSEDVALAYMRWLPMWVPLVTRVRMDGNWIYFEWRWPSLKLLVLEYAPDRSSPDRQLLYIRGGLATRRQKKGRLEFREALNGKSVIAVIHKFRPSIPWYAYRWTQAWVHVWAMRHFNRYLQLQAAKKVLGG
jgi:uncharacterized protein YbjT (DUF2867 family)